VNVKYSVLRRLGRSWSPTASQSTGGRGSVRLRTRWSWRQ